MAALAGPAAAQLAGSEWRPTRIDGTDVPADAEMVIQFGSGGELSGHGGCNRFFGRYGLTDDRIAVDGLGVTRMACTDAVMGLEHRFLRALEEARRYARDRVDLVLSDDTGSPILLLRQRDAD